MKGTRIFDKTGDLAEVAMYVNNEFGDRFEISADYLGTRILNIWHYDELFDAYEVNNVTLVIDYLIDWANGKVDFDDMIEGEDRELEFDYIEDAAEIAYFERDDETIVLEFLTCAKRFQLHYLSNGDVVEYSNVDYSQHDAGIIIKELERTGYELISSNI